MGSRHHEDSSIHWSHSNQHHETSVSHRKIRDPERNSLPSKYYLESDRNNMCWHEHQRLFCPCANVDCKTPNGRCRCPEECSQPDTKGRRGHFLDKCHADKEACDDWVLEQTTPGRLFNPKYCPEYDKRVVPKVVGLCKTCQKDCADKQTGPNLEKKIERAGPDPKKKNKTPSSFSCCTVS